MFKQSNLNKNLKVKLTPTGKKIIAEYYSGLNVDLNNVMAKFDAEGYFTMSMHEFVSILGPHLFVGNMPGKELPIEMDFLIEAKEISNNEKVLGFGEQAPTCERLEAITLKNVTGPLKVLDTLIEEIFEGFGIEKDYTENPYTVDAQYIIKSGTILGLKQAAKKLIESIYQIKNKIPDNIIMRVGSKTPTPPEYTDRDILLSILETSEATSYRILVNYPKGTYSKFLDISESTVKVSSGKEVTKGEVKKLAEYTNRRRGSKYICSDIVDGIISKVFSMPFTTNSEFIEGTKTLREKYLFNLSGKDAGRRYVMALKDKLKEIDIPETIVLYAYGENIFESRKDVDSGKIYLDLYIDDASNLNTLVINYSNRCK